ncbi:MAG: GNAT family N-acetyltransferase, partial [Gammaproteobacteria bacterium]|nr:GNAT family N-acetyltransferase [Gammaproteobacteria bacterium]
MSLKLQPSSMENISTVFSWITTERMLLQWTGNILSWPLDNAQLEKYICISEQNKKLISLDVLDDCCSELIGHIDIDNIDHANHFGEIIRVILKPDMQGRG